VGCWGTIDRVWVGSFWIDVRRFCRKILGEGSIGSHDEGVVFQREFL
jgi:hypothetical protein